MMSFFLHGGVGQVVADSHHQQSPEHHFKALNTKQFHAKSRLKLFYFPMPEIEVGYFLR